MTSDHPRVLIATAALALALAAAGAAAVTIAGTDLEAAELVADLPWAFEVTVEPPTEDDGPVRTTRYRFQSTSPSTRTTPGDVYLRAELTALKHDDAGSAEAAFEELLAGADPNIGLSYAWDQRLEGAVRRRRGADQRVVACRCGGGCREAPATPTPPTQGEVSAHGF